MLFAVLLFVVALATYAFFARSKAKGHPPGPKGLPFIGQALSMNWKHQERSFMKWYKEFGPIYKVTAGLETVVVLSDPELIREAYSKPEASARRKNAGLELFYADKGIIFTSGDLWHETRRFTLFHLRNFGMGKSKLEEVMHDQITQYMEGVITSHEGTKMMLDKSLNVAVFNIIWGMVAGESLSLNDPRALKVMHSREKLLSLGAVFAIIGAVPAVRKLPYRLTGLDEFLKLFHVPIDTLLRPAIEGHRKTVDLDGEPRDYIDCLLQEQRRRPQLFTDRHLLRCIIDLFIAGFDTTATTLRWAFCFLCSRQDVQERLYDEIRHVVSADRLPTLADRPRLPYVEAVLMETQRLANVTPIGVEHIAEKDLQLGGYTVPRGAHIVSLLIAVHQNEQHFPKPGEFRPERFLDADGKVRPSRALMPFSVGKRSCLGESMARAELFLFVTRVVQRYRLRFPDGFTHDFAINEEKSLFREPKPYSLIPERRSD